jgi:hypothetical protein
MTPHIVALVSAKLVCFADIPGAWRGARTSVYCEVPRAHLTLASHGGGGEHRCGNQRRRYKFQFNHSASPFDERPTAFGSCCSNGEMTGSIKATHDHIASTPREHGVSRKRCASSRAWASDCFLLEFTNRNDGNSRRRLPHCRVILTPPTAADSSTPTLAPCNSRITPLAFSSATPPAPAASAPPAPIAL